MIWFVSIVVIGGVVYLLGWDIRGWFSQLWDTLTQVSAKYLIPALVLQTFQTLFTAVAWLAILRYAYPDSGIRARQVIACYATSVALNTFLPANIGTLVMLIMFTAIIVGADLRRDLRRLSRREDLLHRDRRRCLRLSLRLGGRLLRHQVRLGLGASLGDRDHRGRRRASAS